MTQTGADFMPNARQLFPRRMAEALAALLAQRHTTAKQIARDAAAGRIDPERVGEATVTGHLHRPDIPDVDLFIRTSGEQRSSNFMLWQAAYAEYVFQDKLWPDYDRRDLWAACEEYVHRNRRFGRA